MRSPTILLLVLFGHFATTAYGQRSDSSKEMGGELGPVGTKPSIQLPCSGLSGRCQVIIQPNGVVPFFSLKPSCSAIKAADSDAPSGEYILRTTASYSKIFKAYCEMGLNGGGYTFLHPTALSELSDADVQAIFTDKRSFLMRYRENTGRQSYAVLGQLNAYSSTDLMIGLNHNTGYANPVNSSPGHLGNSYLYFGFLPVSIAASTTTQGLKVNGNQVTFRNCDSNPNSHLTLFPNFAERIPSTYGNGFGAYGSVCSQIESLRQPNPSSRVMPVDYFMFMEMHWGGCGCYGSTDHRSNTILATSIGFR